MRRLRLLRIVIIRSGAGQALAVFFAIYLVCGALVWIFEPGVDTYLDALWFLWAVSTTVGLGDYTAITPIGRIATIACSVCAITTTAIFTAVVVDYFNEMRQHQRDASLAEFLDKLERLPDLSPEELEHISDTVRKMRK